MGEFMTFFRESFPQATVPIKMHLLEDHAVPWAKSFHVGFGLLGEQGAESIHAKFTRLSLSYTAITDKVQHLLCIVKEHLISISPQVVAAIPPPKKKNKIIILSVLTRSSSIFLSCSTHQKSFKFYHLAHTLM